MTTDADRKAARLAAGQWSVLDYDDLLACGLTPMAIRVRVERGILHRLYYGVYAWGHHNIPLEGRWLAAVKACGPYAVLEPLRGRGAVGPREVGLAAGRHHGSDEAPSSADRRAPQRHRRAHGPQGHPGDAEAAHDHRSRQDRGRSDRQAGAAAGAVQCRGARAAAARIVDLGADRTNSPLEDDALDFVVRHGLERPPEVNAPYRLSRTTVYPDLRWPELQIIVEVDSRKWHDDPLGAARRRAAPGRA